MIEAEGLPSLNAVEVIGRFLGSIRGYEVPRFVRGDYLASYEGDRLTRSAASLVMRRFSANGYRMRAWTFWRPAIASGRNEHQSSSRSSRIGCLAAFEDSRSWRRRC